MMDDEADDVDEVGEEKKMLCSVCGNFSCPVNAVSFRVDHN